MSVPTTNRKELDPYAITIGLLRSDIRILAPLLLLLSLSSLFELTESPNEGHRIWIVLLIERLLQLTVATTVVHRWRRRIESSSRPGFGLSTILFKNVALGMTIWVAMLAPLLALGTAEDSGLVAVAAAATTAALVMSVNFFFYSSVTGLLGGSLRAVLSRARAITRAHPYSALQAFLGPFALTVLVVGLLSVPYPDGRSALWSALASAGESVFWLLSTYTSLAFSLILIDDNEWRAAGLNPYRHERLETIHVQGDGLVARLLVPRTAAKVLVLSGLMLLGNLSRKVTTPPAPKITLKSIEVADRAVSVTLELRDPVYHFRGFKPSWFTLASDAGYPVATGITRASLTPEGKERLTVLPSSAGPVTLYLSFSTDRNRRDLAALENLWLWYQLRPLMAIPKELLGNLVMGESEIPAAAPPGAVAFRRPAQR